MGLDMYLKAEKYIGGWAHSDADERERFHSVLKAAGLEGCETKDSPFLEVSVTVACWRKANAIHKWFVDNVQDGEDDCRNAYVSREQLIALRDACRLALNTAETVEGDVYTGTTYYPDGRVVVETQPGRVIPSSGAVEKILPTQGGFFFGSTDYDEYYLNTVRRTHAMLDSILANPAMEHCQFYYNSSW